MKYLPVSSEFGPSNRDHCATAVKQAISAGEKVVVFDLIAVEAMDSSGVEMLQEILDEAEDNGVVVVLDNVRVVVHSLLQLLKLDTHFFIRLVRFSLA
jgi:anti-anti-sigma factor